MAHTVITARTDAEILSDATDALDRRRSVPGGVHVRVKRGVVILTGRVYLPFERAEAEDAIRDVDGVRRVVNEIVVLAAPTGEGFQPPDDAC